MRNSRITLVALLSTLLGSACYSPSYEGSGGFKCATNGQCPEGFSCSPQKVCIKGGTTQPDLAVDSTSRVEAGADKGADAITEGGTADHGRDLPAGPSVTCSVVGGSVKTIEANNVTGQFGFALDESEQTLYASFVTKTTGARVLYVRSHKVGSTGWGPDLLKLPLEGTGALDPASTAIAAAASKWVAVYQDTLNNKQELRAVDKAGTPTSLASDNLAGAAPDVLVGPGMQGFIAVHQTRATVLGNPEGEIIVVDDLKNVVARYKLKSNTQHPATGITNRLAFSPATPPTPPDLLYAGVVANSLVKEPSAVLLFTIPLKVPIQLNPVETIIGSSSLPPAGAGADIVADGHLVFGRQEGNGSQVFYRAPGKTSVEPVTPGGKVLEKVSIPRVAARDGLVGVVMMDTAFKLHVSVRDDRNGTWSADLPLPEVAAQASIAATRGQANEVIFHVAYRAGAGGPRLLHQPITCTKK